MPSLEIPQAVSIPALAVERSSSITRIQTRQSARRHFYSTPAAHKTPPLEQTRWFIMTLAATIRRLVLARCLATLMASRIMLSVSGRCTVTRPDLTTMLSAALRFTMTRTEPPTTLLVTALSSPTFPDPTTLRWVIWRWRVIPPATEHCDGPSCAFK